MFPENGILIVKLAICFAIFSFSLSFDEDVDRAVHSSSVFNDSGSKAVMVAALERQKMFRNMRIHIHYSDLSLELSSEDESSLKETVEHAVRYIQGLLSVIPVQGSLLLNRDGCRSRWFKGVNKGRCSAVQRRYTGEYCLDFKLPDEHLEGLVTWDRDSAYPARVWYNRGAGLKNTDYVLYVQAVTSSHCMESQSTADSNSVLIAYATYCKLDSNNQPVAGYMNFCPSEFHQYKSDYNRVFLTILHEMFHALGFSRELFMKFKDCSKSVDGLHCPDRDPPVFRMVGGVLRLVTPAVVRKVQEHFNCSTPGFGGALQVHSGTVQSHWDSFLMQGSIMTPTMGLPDLTFIDPITLAVFEDTSWYKVNFRLADEYLWGKNMGCEFGAIERTDQACEEGHVGCSFLNTHKARCVSSRLGNGNIYEPIANGSCIKELKNYAVFSSGLYTYSSRCFLSNMVAESYGLSIYATKPEGRCFNTRCVNYIQLEVTVGGLDWFVCNPGDEIRFPGYTGVLKCPTNIEAVCRGKQRPMFMLDKFRTASKVEATTTKSVSSSLPVDASHDVGVTMVTDNHFQATANGGVHQGNQLSYLTLLLFSCAIKLVSV